MSMLERKDVGRKHGRIFICKAFRGWGIACGILVNNHYTRSPADSDIADKKSHGSEA